MAANWLSPHCFSAYILAYNSTVSVVYSFLGRMAVVLMLQVGGGGGGGGGVGQALGST